MMHEMKFLATPEKGEVSALLVRPENATHLLVLGHGATEGCPRLAPAGGRPFLQRTHDFDGGVRITARGRSRPGLLLLSAPLGGQARDEAGRPPRGRHGT